MSRETLPQVRQRCTDIYRMLLQEYPRASIELHFTTPFELLVAVVLSAQTTDQRVNQVTPALFRAYPSIAAMAEAVESDVERHIQSVGLFRTKARALIALARELRDIHDSTVPTRRADLATLPGVGQKTAGVVSMHLHGDPAFPVDTHVMRLAHRLNLSRGKTPDAVEADLQKRFPQEAWFLGHQLLIWHGRRTCFARSPECHRCVVRSLCPQTGVARSRAVAESKSRPMGKARLR